MHRKMRCRVSPSISRPARQATQAMPLAETNLVLAPELDGRWQVIKRAWRAELRDALRLTKGNLELAVAIAATMIFSD